MFTNLIAKFQEKLNSDIHFAELIKGSGIAFILRIVGIIAGYIFTLLVTRTLGAEAWGIFSLSLVVLQIAVVIGKFGMDTAVLKLTAKYSAKKKWDFIKKIYLRAIKITSIVSSFIAIILFLISPYIAKFIFHKSYLSFYLKQISFMIVPFVLLIINTEVLKGLKKVIFSIFLSQVSIFLFTITFFSFSILMQKQSINMLFISYTISILLLAIISIIIVTIFILQKTKGITQQNKIKKELQIQISYNYLLRTSIPMFLGNSLALIMGWIDILMLGIMDTTTSVGIYSVILKVVGILNIILLSVDTLFSPKFVELLKVNKIQQEKLQQFVNDANKIVIYTSLPLVIIFVFFSKNILGIFGNEFQSGSIALVILTLNRFFRYIFGAMNPSILYMSGNQHIYVYILLASIIINVILNYLLIPVFSINGAAISTLVSIFLLSLTTGFFIKKKLKINPFFKIW